MRLDAREFDHVTQKTVRDARVIKLNLAPFGNRAITIGRFIFTKHVEDKKLLAHELVHVEQFKRYGFFGFLARYLKDYLKLRFNKKFDHRQAYRSIYFEVAARTKANKWAERKLPRRK